MDGIVDFLVTYSHPLMLGYGMGALIATVFYLEHEYPRDRFLVLSILLWFPVFPLDLFHHIFEVDPIDFIPFLSNKGRK